MLKLQCDLQKNIMGETMEEEKKLAKRRKLNMKLYPIYKMISTDVLFYNAVKVLFLTQVKLISNANVVFLESLYAFFKMIFTIPMTTIAAKLGKRRSIVLGNILVTLEFVTILISRNFMFLVLSQIISALGWSLRSTTESPFLNSSIPETKNKGKIFTKIDSKGYSKYCYIAAIATILAGFFYEINPYIPLILSILFDTIGLIISLNFIDVDEEEKVETKTITESIIEVKNDFKFIFKSPRLKSLLLMLRLYVGNDMLIWNISNNIIKRHTCTC